MRTTTLVTTSIAVLWVSLVVAAPPPNLQDALRAQQTQANLHPGDSRILNDLGNLLVLAGALDEAEDAYRRSLEIEPENTTTRYNLGLVLMEQGHGKQAKKEFDQVLHYNPSHAWSLYQLGTINASAGRRRQAVDYYTRSLILDPALASPAVNPHILENHFLTEAQLRSYLAQPEAAQAPRLYERPGEVADLLVSQPLPEATRETPPEPQAEGSERPPTSTPEAATEIPPARAQEPPIEPSSRRPKQPEEGDSARVITEQDLAPTAAGQGVGHVGTPGEPASTRATSRPGSAYTRPTTPRSGTVARPTPPQQQTVTPQPQSPPGSQSFVPTLGSTGRLELELLDEEPSAAIAPGP